MRIAIANAGDDVLAAICDLRQAVAGQCAWSGEELLEHFLVVVVREDRRALGDSRGQSARVIEMRV